MKGFKPLGYRFEIASLMQPPAVKQAIRRKKHGWFRVKNGPRGWIVGPIICLWMSAIDSHGPMIVALLRNDGKGSIITGRAGADLNGTSMLLLLVPLMGWLVWQLHDHGQGWTRIYILVGTVMGLAVPLTLWINSKDRRRADPLISFLRRTVGQRYKK